MVKMIKKGFLIVILVILTISFYGCGRANIDEPREYNYRTGTRGLTLRFPTNAPREIYENDEDVRLLIEIRNEGAFPQSDEKSKLEYGFGRLWIGGHDPGILKIGSTLTSAKGGDIVGVTEGVDLDEDELEGKSTYNRAGGYSAVEFTMNVYELPDGMPFYRPRLIVTATYEYMTIANPIVCVDPNPRSTRVREKVCEIGDYSAVGWGGGSGRGGSVGAGLGSQGAPIAVTRIEEDVTSKNILFKIYIQNVGDGLVIPLDDAEGNILTNPNRGYDWRDMNRVEIEGISLGNLREKPKCRPDDWVELIDDRGYIFCSFSKENIKEAYVTPLNIKLKYGYSNSIERDIEIFEEVIFEGE